jgi:hypothetical protein
MAKNKLHVNQSLVDSVMIDAELNRKEYGSIPATVIRRGLEPLIVRVTPEPD